jgi:hypothetical protein
MNETVREGAVDEPAIESAHRGKTVVTEDGLTLGTVEAETETHLRVRADESAVAGGQLWLPKEMMAGVAGSTVRLNRERADLHDAVLAMPPGQQREFGTLSLNVRIGRARGLGHTGR